MPKKDKPLQILLDAETHERLRVAAFRSRTDKSKIVRELIVKELDRLEAQDSK